MSTQQPKGFTLKQEGAWVFITLLPEISVEGIQFSLDEFSEVLDKELPFVVLTDTTNGDLPRVKQRVLFIDFMNSNRSRFARLCLGWALIITSVPQRIVTTALGWLIPSVYPMMVFSNKEKAEAWLTKKINA